MRGRLVRQPNTVSAVLVMVVLAGAVALGAGLATAASHAARAVRAAGCPDYRRVAVAADPRPRALRVFAVQFGQQPADMVTAQNYRHAVECVMRREVAPYLARERPNLVVFDEDVGLETLAIGPRGAKARYLLRHGSPSCRGKPFPCETLASLTELNRGYSQALAYLEPRFPALGHELGRAFVAATDEFVRVFMGTMAAAALRYHVYIAASNTQVPFRTTSDLRAVRALRDPGAAHVSQVYEPTSARPYDQTFLWGPRVTHPHRPAPLANLLAVNRKVPLTSFEQVLGFAAGPATGPAAVRNLEPYAIPGTHARLGFATSLPAFVYGGVSSQPCADVALTYMRCLDHLGANVLIQADANDGQWTGGDGSDTREHWQPLSWMGSAWRAVSDPTVHFAYAVNPMLVGNLADTPFDGQSAILERGRHGPGCHYVGAASFVPGQDDPALRSFAGAKPQFLALAPWVVSDRSRAALRAIGQQLAAGRGSHHYVQTALVADLPFPVDRSRSGCVIAGGSR
jgi:hypothetical protein